MQGVISLRPHQVEAVDSIIEGLTLPLDGTVPAAGRRGQVHMSTGSGKTITAAVAALRMVPRGVVGVLVPTLDLLTQTVEAWRAVGHKAPAVAVCSLGADPLLEALDVRCTTNPTQLALWTGHNGPMLVFATYASLSPQGLVDDQGDEENGAAPGALERALRGSYGQTMRPFDLLVVDEAHRTSGDLGKAWASVHNQARIPAVRRLYMTATPRLWEAAPGSAGADETGGRLVASMNDVDLYGNVLFEFGLMESVERGVLARFEIDVLEIRDPQAPGPDASVEERRGRCLAALQEALLKHADESGVRSFMTFHSRTLDAMAFARALPETAAELHATDPVTYPGRVGAEWLSGEHPATHRRTVLGRFADGIDAEGWVTDLGVLSSCRVLGEGVDIRGKRGVGAVVFADTRSSPVEIVQIIGRGLRQDPGEGKISRIIVPVFLEPGEDPSDMMASASYRSLVAVLQGLRAHDARVIERLALPTTTARGKATSVVALDPDREDTEDCQEHDADQNQEQTATAPAGTEHDTAGTSDEDETGTDADEEEHPGAGVPLLRFSLPRDPGTVALFLRTRVLHPDSEIWLTGYNALRHWVAKHGNAEVPLDEVVELGEDRIPYALGAWVSEQRRAFRLGTLKAWRAELLNELGMVWSVADAGFWKNLTAARTYYAVHGTLAAPKDTVVEGVAVGQWLANLRKAGGLGTDQERAGERRAALEAIDPEWCPEWSVEWQRHYATARALLAEEGGLTKVLPGVLVHGYDVGAWINRQGEHAVWTKLLPEQHKRLEALGLTPLPAVPARKTASTAGAFERGVLALEQYRARTGTVTVPRTHIETVVVDGQEHGVKLGVFLTNSKTRRAKMTADKLAVLAALGLDWAA
ncbi:MULTISPECIES: Helicase associated domain protein [unclassified Streptomyces]|uniref:DEAD/DEAH box helicase n=1 Tax=unclassified Streptomyces TaxID=2593676 RepID=UPI002E153DCA|nr:Helicase associated domain protein [Streptomyces sp. NBC_01213]WSR04524.1 Helicase associated domain protein [Streptomyces sp. NBC_01208]